MLFSRKSRFVDAIARGDVETLRALVRKRPSLLWEEVDWKHKGNGMHSLPLHYAACCNKPEVLSFLVGECGMPVDTQEGAGKFTALHYALWANSCDAATTLLQLGADREKQDAAGHTAYDFCKTEETRNVMKSEMEEIIMKGGVDELRAYLEKNPGQQDRYMKLGKKEYTGFALNAAVIHDRPEIITFLVREVKVDIDRQAGHRGRWTALHHACDAGNVRAVAALLALGANPWLTNGEGKTPLDVAQREEIRALFVPYVEARQAAEKAEKERREKERRDAEASGTWRRLSDVEIMRERKLPGHGLLLTDIFNFRSRRWTALAMDPQSGHLTQNIFFFDDVADKEELRHARAKLADLGGSPDPDSVDGRVIQKSKAPKPEAPGR